MLKLNYTEFKAIVKFLYEKKCGLCTSNHVSLHLHHIDGNHLNNAINNVVPLCKNCHRLVHKLVNRHINLPEKNVLRLQKIFEGWVVEPDVKLKKKARM